MSAFFLAKFLFLLSWLMCDQLLVYSHELKRVLFLKLASWTCTEFAECRLPQNVLMLL